MLQSQTRTCGIEIPSNLRGAVIHSIRGSGQATWDLSCGVAYAAFVASLAGLRNGGVAP